MSKREILDKLFKLKVETLDLVFNIDDLKDEFEKVNNCYLKTKEIMEKLINDLEKELVKNE